MASETTNEYPVLIYEQDHEILGHCRMEVTVTGFTTIYALYINDMFASKSGYSDPRMSARMLKGFTLTGRR